MKPMLINRLIHLEELVILSIYRESIIGKQEYQIVVLLYIVHQPSCCSTSLSLQFPTASHKKLLNNLSFIKCLYEDSSKYESNLIASPSSLFFQICVWCRGKFVCSLSWPCLQSMDHDTDQDIFFSIIEFLKTDWPPKLTFIFLTSKLVLVLLSMSTDVVKQMALLKSIV